MVVGPVLQTWYLVQLPDIPRGNFLHFGESSRFNSLEIFNFSPSKGEIIGFDFKNGYTSLNSH